MKSGLFKTVQAWIKAEIGLELMNLVWVITLLIPATTYRKNTIKWLRDNLSNTMPLDMRTPEAVNLQIWANKQPVSSLLSWLPSFETARV